MDYIAHLRRTVPHWFSARYLEFAGQQNKLPFDAHTLVALVAPRPLLNTNATEDEYNNTLSIEAGIRTGRLVYDWMQLEDRCRLHWRPGKHGQMEDDWRALLDYADECFFDKRGTSEFNKWVYPEFTPPLTWEAPKPDMKHNKWISIGETTEGQTLFDKILRTGPGPRWNEDRESFLEQGFETVKFRVNSGQVEGINRGDNVFEITTKNVKDFSLWLHPRMVDFSQPITVSLNGSTLTRTATPSLLDALRSYQRHQDWGLIYHSELKITVQ